MRQGVDLSPVRQKVEIRAAMGCAARVIERVHQQRVHEKGLSLTPQADLALAQGMR